MIDLTDYTCALVFAANGDCMIHVDAAKACLSLAVRQALRQQAPAADADCVTLRARVDELMREHETSRLQIGNLNAHLSAERQRLLDLSAQWQFANDAHRARIAELTAQLHAANNRPEALEAMQTPELDELADGDRYHARLVARQDAYDKAGTRVIDWNGLPSEYQGDLYRLVDGTVKWSEMPIPARRSIALYAIGQLANDDNLGSLTMAEYAENKPLFMPSASAIAQMFGIRWTQVVENAAAHSAKAVAP